MDRVVLHVGGIESTRMGDQRNVTHVLEDGRRLLDSLRYPERPDNHFVVDHDKFDYYAMDCYRLIGDDKIAEASAQETLRKAIGPDGTKRAPMRAAEAELTLGVVAARRGDLQAALNFGRHALAIDRRSQPSLLMVASELADAMDKHHPSAADTHDFRAALTRIGSPGAA